jgi:hypothetical protein
MAKLSKAELAKREDVIMKMKQNKRSLVKRYGPDAEKVMYGRATNIAKKVAETQMEKSNLKELVRAALMQEKSFPDLTGDGKVTYADVLKGRGVDIKEGPEDRDWAVYVKSLVNDIRLNGVGSYKNFSEDDFIADFEEYIGDKMVGEDYDPDQAQLDDEDEIPMSYDDEGKPLGLGEDLDLGHEDDEPHMLKSDLYHIGKYAMNLYQMVDQFEGKGEVDFPHWWQAKIIKAKEMMSSAKHYLDFELKEPEIDAAVDVIDASDALNNVGVDEGLPKGYFKKATAELDENQVDMFATKASRTDNAKETYFKFLKDFAKSAGVSGEELGKMSYNDLENKFGEKLARKYELKKSNVADRARELVSKGVIQVDESFEKLVGKLKKGGKSEKAAKAIAGAVAQYKAKGGGKGPTAKQKARG